MDFTILGMAVLPVAGHLRRGIELFSLVERDFDDLVEDNDEWDD